MSSDERPDGRARPADGSGTVAAIAITKDL
jgi:hypothetical protein